MYNIVYIYGVPPMATCPASKVSTVSKALPQKTSKVYKVYETK